MGSKQLWKCKQCLHEAGITGLIRLDIDNLLCLFLSAGPENSRIVWESHRESNGTQTQDQLSVSGFVFGGLEVLTLFIWVFRFLLLVENMAKKKKKKRG